MTAGPLAALLLAWVAAPAAAQALTPLEGTLSVPADEIVAIDRTEEQVFREGIVRADLLKREGRQFPAFRALYDAVPTDGPEDALWHGLAQSPCAEGTGGTCLFQWNDLAVPLDPAPVSSNALSDALDRWPHREDPNWMTSVRYGWNRVTDGERTAVMQWFHQARDGSTIACDEDECRRLFGVSTETDAAAAQAVAGRMRWWATREGLPTASRPLLVACVLPRAGANFGPPEDCAAVLAEVNGELHALSVLARYSGPPPPSPPPSPPPPPPPPVSPPPAPFLRVAIGAQPVVWLAKQIEQALIKPQLTFQAVASKPTSVQVSSPGFRASVVYGMQKKEWASFVVKISPSPMGWLLTIDADKLRLTKQNNSADLRRASEAERAAYQQAVRTAIRSHLAATCAQQSVSCDMS